MGKIWDIQVIENVELLQNKKWIIYGTSGQAERMWKLIEHTNIEIVTVCDGSPEKIGKCFNGHVIQKFSECFAQYSEKDIYILICSQYVEEIVADCERVSSKQWNYITPFGFQYAYLLNRKNEKLYSSFRQWYCQEWNLWYSLQKNQFMNFQRSEYLNLLLQLSYSDPVLIYAVPKVGSTTVQNILDKAGIKNIHVHHLMPQFNFFNEEEAMVLLKQLEKIKEQKKKNGKTVKIISLVSDPLLRDISDVFQRTWNPSDEIFNHFLEFDNTIFIENVLQCVTEKLSGMGEKIPLIDGDKKNSYEYIARQHTGGYTFNWFREELKQSFSIDVFQYPFDKKEGYTLIKFENIECLLIKYEALHNCMPIMKEFTGTSSLDFMKRNPMKQKTYSYVFEQFIENVEFPSELLDHYYTSNEIKHFFLKDEITAFRNKWKEH